MKIICGNRSIAGGFTLIEVMVAVGIFFMAMFSILGVLASSLHAASLLRESAPTASMVAGQFSITNKLELGSSSGNFGDIAGYEGYRWVADTREAATNGLLVTEFAIINKGGNVDSSLTVLYFKPDSANHMGLR